MVGSWQGEDLEMEKLNPLPSSSRGDYKALEGVKCSIRKETQGRGNTLSPRGSGRGPRRAIGTQKVRKVRQSDGFPPVSPRAGWLLLLFSKTQD